MRSHASSADDSPPGLWRLSLALLATLSACESKQQPPFPPPTIAKAAVLPAPAAKPGATEAQPVAGRRTALQSVGSLLERIPKEAALVAVGPSPRRVLDRLGRVELAARFREPYEQGVAEVTRRAGHNLLDPTTWAAIGVAADKPFGFAWLDGASETVAFFATLTDAAKLEATLTKIAGPLVVEKVGAARILHEKGSTQLNVVLRKDSAAIVTGGRGERALEAARRLAGLSAEASIARSSSFATATRGLRGGTDLAVVLNVQSLLAQALDAQAGSFERRLLAGSLNGLGAAALGIDLIGPPLKAHLWVGLKPGSTLMGIFGVGKGVPALVSALDRRPVWLSTVALEPQGLVALAAQIAQAQGATDDFERGKDMVRGLVGVDFDHLDRLITGELGLAMTAPSLETILAPGFSPAQIGGAVVVGLNDPKLAQEILDRLAATPPAREVAKRGPDGRLTIEVPGWRSITVGIAGRYLAASSDPALLDRLAKGDVRATFAASLSGPLATLVTQADPSQLWLADIAFFGSWGVAEQRRARPPTAVEPADEPRSAAYEAKREALRALRDRRWSEAQARAQAENRRLVGMLEGLGLAAARIDRLPDGLAIEAGLYFRPKGLPALIGDLVEAGAKSWEHSQQGGATWQKNWAEEQRLQAELNALRRGEGAPPQQAPPQQAPPQQAPPQQAPPQQAPPQQAPPQQAPPQQAPPQQAPR